MGVNNRRSREDDDNITMLNAAKYYCKMHVCTDLIEAEMREALIAQKNEGINTASVCSRRVEHQYRKI